VQALRDRGVRAGLFRPVTLWPFPIEALRPLVQRARGLIMVEAGSGQLENELRLALSHAGLAVPRVERIQHFGGVLPAQREIEEFVSALAQGADKGGAA
jgi:pyruvate/2-oxoacid:ferredoxin oxidoreductase alpha subunit